MRQTAEKAVPFAKSGAKPQRESEETKNIEKRRAEIPEGIRHEAGFTIIDKSEPQSLKRCLGNKNYYKIRQKVPFLSKKVFKMNILRILRV